MVGAVGAVVSPPPGQAAVETLAVFSGDLFPAASNASTPTVYVVPQVNPEKDALSAVVVG